MPHAVHHGIERPKQLDSNCKDEPIRPGPHRLRLLGVRLLWRLSVAQRVALQILFTRLLTVISISTSCSGTDAPLLVWRELALALEEVIGVKITIKHVFSCEKDKCKRDFLTRVWPGIPRIFCDVLGLSSGSPALCHDGSCKLPGDCGFGHAHYSGFPCTSASNLNPHSQTHANLNCIKTCTDATGSVFDSLARALAQQDDLIFIVLENVLSLCEGSNLDEVLSRLQGIGFLVKVSLSISSFCKQFLFFHIFNHTAFRAFYYLELLYLL